MKKIAFLLVGIIFLFSGCGQKKTISVHDGDLDIPGIIESKKDSEFVYKLYSLKKSSSENETDVRTVVNTLPYLSETIKELTVEDDALNISYSIGLRSKYRNLFDLERKTKQIALTVFSVIKDINTVSVSVYDVYGKFEEKIWENATVSDSYGAEYFTPENINKSSEGRDVFESYLLKVLDLKCEEDGNEIIVGEINKKITDNQVIDFESFEVSEMVYKGESVFAGFDLNKCAEANGINMEKYMNMNLTFAVCKVVDFTNGDISKHLIVFKGDLFVMYE